MRTLFHIIFLGFIVFTSCQNFDTAVESKKDNPITFTTLFSKVSVKTSGITFHNRIEETPELNYLTYNNIFSGGGVAVGDINNDGLPDIYFTGNQVEDKLYINKGNLQFEDVTKTAITSGNKGWHRGVTMVDINNDGYLDIYVCRSGWQPDVAMRTNLLYINNGNTTFTEAATQYGLADTSHSTQAAFFDYDKDGDLDCYVLNHPPERRPDQKPFTVEAVKQLVAEGKAESDRLYRNDGNNFYTDVTHEAGLYNFAYGLGIGISDFDNNG